VRLVVGAEDRRASDVARRVFGVHSVSSVEEHELRTFDDVLAAAEARFAADQGQDLRRAGSDRARGTLSFALAARGNVKLVAPDVILRVLQVLGERWSYATAGASTSCRSKTSCTRSAPRRA
jgi:hypothetical protein